jgi:hypothetical protein
LHQPSYLLCPLRKFKYRLLIRIDAHGSPWATLPHAAHQQPSAQHTVFRYTCITAAVVHMHPLSSPVSFRAVLRSTLSNNDLQGTIPSAIAELTGLTGV